MGGSGRARSRRPPVIPHHPWRSRVNNHPKSRRARALRALGIIVVIVGTCLAIPVVLVKLFSDAKGERR
nr:hypothetical protein GCM10017606_29710 [Microbacterium terregens]